MVAIIKNGYHPEGSIKLGEAFLGKNNMAFDNINEAYIYGNSHHGHGNFTVYPLCSDCAEGSYKDAGTIKYPSMKKLIKKVKIMPND